MQAQDKTKEEGFEKRSMKKRMTIMLIALGILFGVIFLYKGIVGLITAHYMAAPPPPVTVSAMPVGVSAWEPKVKAVASLRAIRGVNVTTELAGMVTKIYFKPGAYVNQGEILVQLNADSDIALLHSLQAQAELAKVNYTRDKAQYAVQAISKATLDTDIANVKSTQAQVEQQAAIVAKKTIVAPFTGRVGISAVNPGQFLNPGDKVTSLQTVDPIYADFYVPQQDLVQLKVGQLVTLTSDAYPSAKFTGTLTTIDPAVDVATRNAEVEATIANPNGEIIPGMFANVEVIVGVPQEFLTLPQTAISFNPYGEMVFVLTQQGKDKNGKPILIANQAFVTTGATRGDQIEILTGVKKGDTVVTSGQLKLKNGSQVAVNNTITPTDNPAPQVSNDH